MRRSHDILRSSSNVEQEQAPASSLLKVRYEAARFKATQVLMPEQPRTGRLSSSHVSFKYERILSRFAMGFVRICT